MDLQMPPVPHPSPQAPAEPRLAETAGMPPPPKRDSFVMSFVPKKDFSKLLPIVFILFLIVTLPLAVVLVRRRQLSEGQAQIAPIGCVCETVTADRDLNNLIIGDVVSFTGGGRTNYPFHISKIKFVISKNGTVVKVQEVPATLDREEGGWRFYKGEFSYTIEEYGDYEVAIQVACPQGWQD